MSQTYGTIKSVAPKIEDLEADSPIVDINHGVRSNKFSTSILAIIAVVVVSSLLISRSAQNGAQFNPFKQG